MGNTALFQVMAQSAGDGAPSFRNESIRRLERRGGVHPGLSMSATASSAFTSPSLRRQPFQFQDSSGWLFPTVSGSGARHLRQEIVRLQSKALLGLSDDDNGVLC